MPISRTARIAAITCFALLAIVCLATNAYLSYRINYPPRTLKVRILFDSSNPPLEGVLPENLQARVEAVSGPFQQAAGIRLSVAGFTPFKLPSERFDPETLRHYVEVHTPRESSDILIAFWPAPPGDQRLGSALPYSAVVVTRIDASDPEKKDPAILAHQILTAFGVGVSGDATSVMHLPPGSMQLDSTSSAELMDTRLFDFSKGLAGMSRRMRANILASLELSGRADAKAGHPSASPRLQLAELLMRDSQFPAAVEQYRAEVRSGQDRLAAHLGLAAALTQTGEYREAETEARAALQLAPNEGDPHYRLASVLVRAGNPEAAITEYRRAIAIQPNSIRNRTGLAVAYAASLGEFDAADREFHDALKLEPQNPVLLADVDFVNRLRTRLTKQLADAESDVRAHPENGPAHDRLAMLLLRLGQVEKSTAEARESLRLGPDTWHPHYTLALALYAGRDYAGATSALADAKRLGSGGRPYLEDALRTAAANGVK
jgi:Flp pilus assembly protein TadD